MQERNFPKIIKDLNKISTRIALESGRSKNGIVSVLIVPDGNASDSGQLDTMIKRHIEMTKVTPKIISVDDGYSSQ